MDEDIHRPETSLHPALYEPDPSNTNNKLNYSKSPFDIKGGANDNNDQKHDNMANR